MSGCQARPGWPDWAKFYHLGYFLKAQQFFGGGVGGGNGCGHFKKSLEGFDVDVFDFQIELWWRYFVLFWFGDCFGSPFQNLGEFFSQSSGHLLTKGPIKLVFVPGR
jgi:hypothetical protein